MEYGLWKDLGQRELPEQIEQAIGSDFGLNQENSCMQIQIVHKEIGEYVLAAEYCPKEINIGKKASPFDLKLLNSGVRIIWLRTNQEFRTTIRI